MERLPTGTVTFLFTDIEGSTRLWDRHPQAMRKALSRHDEILESLIDVYGGYVFAKGGDSYSAAFDGPTDAIAAAIDIQRALAAEDWGEMPPLLVRVALHTGEAVERRGDYLGPEVNRAARLREAAHGEQILVSGTTWEAADGLPAEIGFRDLGSHRLRDIDEPERLIQIVHPALRSEFPDPRALAALSDNLPVQLSTFVGREDEVATLSELTADSRITTLTGVGGTGKTRLALKVAEETLGRYPDGAWYVDLRELRDPTLLAEHIVRTLGLRDSPKTSAEVVLADRLRRLHTLLVLDNCEHVGGAVASLTDYVLRRAPAVFVLATSRRRLGIVGEAVFRVGPLPVPPLGSVTDYAESGAVYLFLDRASTLGWRPNLQGDDLGDIAQIVAHLDGLPLAIELAAAKVQAFTPSEILARLDRRLDLLDANGPPEVLHRTLRSVMRWSLDLMSSREKQVFRRLGTFTGGFDLTSAERLCASHAVDVTEVPGVIAQLVDQSMVERDLDRGMSRYRLLDTVREFALDELRQATELDEMRSTHADLFIDLAGQGAGELQGPNQARWLDRFAMDHANFQAALDWLLEGSHTDRALELASYLWRYWLLAGYLRLGQQSLAQVLEASRSDEPEVYGAALTGSSLINFKLGDVETATSQIHERMELAESVGDIGGTIDALTSISGFDHIEGRYREGGDALLRALEISKRLQDEWRHTFVLCKLAINHAARGLIGEAGEFASLAVSGARMLADEYLYAEALLARGETELSHRDISAARATAAQVMSIGEASNFRDQLAWAQMLLGRVELLQGRTDDSREWLDQSVGEFTNLGEVVGLTMALAYLAIVKVKNEDPGTAEFLTHALELAEGAYQPAVPVVLDAIATQRIRDGRMDAAIDMLGRSDASRARMGITAGPIEAALRDVAGRSLRAGG